ncbi:phage tail protein [Yokenella regensburgei]|uniref:phage tail protein n=1 Tax=Yokenella regensburgei TaxID=158877 RepID=UPI003ED8CBE7
MKDLKSRLLAPEHTAHSVSVLGTEVFIRRLTAFELAEYDEKVSQLRDDNNSRGMAIASASLVLTALVDENGLPAQDLPAPDELLKSRSHASLIEALSVVQRHSYGTLEEAKKN